MKQRTMKRLFAAVLSAAMLVTALPAELTPAQAAERTQANEQAAEHTPDASSPLEAFGIIDAAGEEDTTNDLPDRNQTPSAAPYAAANGDLVVAIDPGHGGNDSGAFHGKVKEKDVNLTIAKYIKTYLEEYVGVQVYLTRNDDTYVGLSDRVANAAAAGADVFISIHNNASNNPDTSGSMVFYPNKSYRPDLSAEGAELSTNILRELTAL